MQCSTLSRQVEEDLCDAVCSRSCRLSDRWCETMRFVVSGMLLQKKRIAASLTESESVRQTEYLLASPVTQTQSLTLSHSLTRSVWGSETSQKDTWEDLSVRFLFVCNSVHIVCNLAFLGYHTVHTQVYVLGAAGFFVHQWSIDVEELEAWRLEPSSLKFKASKVEVTSNLKLLWSL